MSQTAQELLRQALALPEPERLALAEDLFSSVEEPAEGGFVADEALAAEWDKELDRRWEKHLQEPARARPFAEVQAEVHKKHGLK